MQINNNKNIEFFSKNLFEIFLNYSWNIKNIKKQDLIPEMIVLNLENYLIFIIFTNG